ncbi:MAG: cell division protein FtsA, partial [Candidatus Rokuibacteriota bacterium]
MGNSRTVAGLDVGTSKICAVIGELTPTGVDIVGLGKHPSRGLRKGVVVNIESTVEAIKRAVQEAEQMAGVEIESVYASIGGGHLGGVNSQGVVAVQGRSREVSTADVERAIEVARDVHLPSDREILHVLTQTFTVDDHDGIREPVGMLGSRLGVAVHLITGAAAAVQNVVRSVNRAGLTVRDVVLQPLAAAESVLTPDERDLGVLLIDIGGGTTDVALFRDGALWHTTVIPLGGDHITNDIAVGLRTPPPDAEELKKLFGCAQTALILEDETVEVPSIGGRKPRVLSRQTLTRIIQARVEEILSLVARGIVQAGLEDAATAGVVVTGGATIMEGVPDLAESIFDLPVRRGIPKWVGGLYDRVESPVYA